MANTLLISVPKSSPPFPSNSGAALAQLNTNSFYYSRGKLQIIIIINNNIFNNL